ncbi:MAG TPA: PAS domain S-box protein, partial [Ohtaekwangia sp.]|nr:PAS domain S-box protein [Ohtaekwangia sp.]
MNLIEQNTLPVSYQLLEHLPVAIYICDTKGKISYFNPAAAILWGRKPIIGQDLWCGSWRIFAVDGAAMALDDCPMAITLKEGRPVLGHEIIIERPNGERLNILPHPHPIFNEDGMLQGAINMLVDITKLKVTKKAIDSISEQFNFPSKTKKDLENETELKTEHLNQAIEKLRRNEQLYHRMIVEVQDYAILSLNKDGFIENWNKGAEKIKGYTAEEIIGKNMEVFYTEEDKRDGLPKKLLTEARNNGRTIHEGWRVRKDGSK